MSTPSIRKLDLRNFKAFRKLTIQFEEDAFLVGPNNAGKSTVIAALKACAYMLRYAKYRPLDNLRDDGPRQVWTYAAEPAQFGLLAENLRHEFHPQETRIELRFSSRATLRAVWPEPAEDSEDDLSNGYFYLFSGKGSQPRRPRDVRTDFPEMGVVPILTPIEHDEDVLTREYVRQHVDGRLASRHFRNHLYWIEDLVSGGSFSEWRDWCNEWAPDFKVRDLVRRDGQVDVYLSEPGGRFPKEVFWAGDGIQIWLQAMFHLYRLRGASTVVLDEPDVYLHPDLQRRLVRVLQETGSQTITATHSAEVLTEASSSSVTWLDKSLSKAVRAPETNALAALSESLGTHFNLPLARALRSKVALFVEGDDLKLLRNVARTIGAMNVANEIGIAEIPLTGYSHWSHAEAFAWLVKDFLKDAVAVVVVLDRDYRTRATLEGVSARFKDRGVDIHIWRKKELESYLLVPSALARLSGAPERMIEDRIAEAAESLRSEVFSRMLGERMNEQRPKGVDLVTVADEFQSEFETVWRVDSRRLEICPPKAILKLLNSFIQSQGKKTVSANSISRSLLHDEIDAEMKGLLERIDHLAGRRT